MPLTIEHRNKISEALKGRMPKNIYSIAGWNKGKRGYPAWNKGLKGWTVGTKAGFQSGDNNPMKKDGVRQKVSNAKIGLKTGPENPNYKNGFYTLENRKRYWHYTKSFRYKEWRAKVFERDGYKCVNCNSKGYITAHHVKSWAKFPSLRYEVGNGLTLCEPCHSLTDNYKGRGTKA